MRSTLSEIQMSSRTRVIRMFRSTSVILAFFAAALFLLDLTLIPHETVTSVGTLVAAMLLSLLLTMGDMPDRIVRRLNLFAYGYEAMNSIILSAIMVCFGLEETMVFFPLGAVLLVIQGRTISPNASLLVLSLFVFGIYFMTLVLYSIGFLPKIEAVDISKPGHFVALGGLTLLVMATAVYYHLQADLARRRADDAARAATRELGVVERDRDRIAALHAEAQSLTAQLKDREEDLRDFVQITTHDLMNIAVAARIMSQDLLERIRDKADESEVDTLGAVVEDTKRFTGMLSALQTLFLKSEGEEERQRVDCGLLTNRILDELRPRIEEKGIAVEVGRLPEVEIEQRKLYHVLSNLIGNAVKYVGDKPEPRIRITASEDHGKIQIGVTDNGIGISEREQQTVFKPFKRGSRQDVGEHRAEGLGVGLALVRRIVERWGGSIAVESEAGKGSTFSLEIPKKGRVAPA